jgi:hypothetical protein
MTTTRTDVAKAGNEGWSLYGAPWSQPVAIHGKSTGRKSGENKPNPLRLVATDGKEGVDGSSPSEGSAKALEYRAFSFGSICTVSNVHRIWSRLWSFQVQNAFLVAVAEGVRSCRGGGLSDGARSHNAPSFSRLELPTGGPAAAQRPDRAVGLVRR